MSRFISINESVFIWVNKFSVETVALLSKLSETKHHIEVKVDMDEQDLTSAKAKATYKVSAAVVT